MGSHENDWQRYERLVACLMTQQLSTDLCVTPNARVMGKISGRARQLDALIESRHDMDNARRVIVDAKMRKRKIDVVQIEAFRGLMDDVGATHGYLISPVGHTAAAERRAQELVTISLVPPLSVEDFDPSRWPRCQDQACNGGRVFWDGVPELSLVLAPMAGIGLGTPRQVPFAHYVGKCDRCGRFHVKCLTCQELFSLDDEDGDHQCACTPPWFWLASIESDKAGHKSVQLHATMFTGHVITFDRRSV